ncbi:hypothetical protein [Cupriavidus basilensis]|uniref:hypothetical protein n=1 Tax=Cupriavidus basilensis TaxID=68895 RepID=UPI00075072FF|nr:hypothetical protein [Cupriavidus basilensis]
MGLSTEQLRAAAELVGAAPTLRDAAALWRARHPGVRALLVDALDMRDETAALRLGARSVYLAASNGHCWSVTQRPDEADALILTQD